MLTTTSFSYLLKSYLRENSFNEKELAVLTNLAPKTIKMLLHSKTELCSPETVEQIIKKLNLSPVQAWNAYFNSVYLLYNLEPKLVLNNYKEIEKMIDTAAKNRKQFNQRSVPFHEVKLIDDQLNYLTVGSLVSIQTRHGETPKEEKKSFKKLAKNLKIKESALKDIKNEKRLPTFKELDNLYWSDCKRPSQDSWIRAYVSSVIRLKKLNLQVEETPSAAYLNLLDKLYK